MVLHLDSTPQLFRRKRLALAHFGLGPTVVLALIARVLEKWSGTPTMDEVVLGVVLGTSLVFFLSMAAKQLRLQFTSAGVRQSGLLFSRTIRWENVNGWKAKNSYLVVRSERCSIKILVWQFAEPYKVIKFVFEQLERTNPERWACDDSRKPASTPEARRQPE